MLEVIPSRVQDKAVKAWFLASTLLGARKEGPAIPQRYL